MLRAMGVSHDPAAVWPRSWIPAAWRKRLRGPYRRLLFERAWPRFAADPAAARQDEALLRQLVRGWDNPWSAHPAFLRAALAEASASDGPVLECGSGLTTLLLGGLAAHTGRPLCSLEHDSTWRARVATALRRHAVTGVDLRACPLRAYGDFDWYDIAPADVPSDIALVICDGPPGTTRGGRYGLLPVLRQRLRPGCLILLDDAIRPEEQEIVRRWIREFGARPEQPDAATRIARVRMPC
jgi:hypothetical protein